MAAPLDYMLEHVMLTAETYLFQAESLREAALEVATSDHASAAALLEMALELVQKAERLRTKPSKSSTRAIDWLATIVFDRPLHG